MKKVILCIGTLDTKGPEVQYVKDLIERKRGWAALVMDTGCQGEGYFKADISADEVARAGGSTIQSVRGLKEAGPAARVMTAGAVKLAKELFDSGRFQGVISVGGGTGSSIASAVMRELPIGFPKFMLSTQKIVQAGIRRYVGTRDIAVMPSVVDIAGLNQLTRGALRRSVGAIMGMIDAPEENSTGKDLVFMTMTGLSTGCGDEVRSRLEEEGFEVVVFHAIGMGGETFEEMVKSYPVKGVIELGLNEIGNELFGGLASAGPHRLEAAGKKGIPQVVTPGCVDFINFLAPETLPERYKDRAICYHNPQATLPRMNADELRLVAKTMADKLNSSSGPVRFLVPLRGFSSPDCVGNPFYDPSADLAFAECIRGSLKPQIGIKEIDAHINDPEFAHAVAADFLDIMR